MRRALILADDNTASPRIRERVEQILLTDPNTQFHFVVPAARDAERGEELGRQRLEQGLAALDGVQTTITGTVGDSQAMRAAGDEMERQPFQLILLSAAPTGASRWVRLDLPHRLARRFGVRVEHLEAGESEPAPAATRDDGAPRAMKADTVSVLLVEDNPEDVELTRIALDRASVPHTAHVASNGASALAYLRDVGEGAIDLIILDLKMPILDGFEFLEEAAVDVDLDRIMVVILSTSSRDEDRHRAHELGAAAYMVKESDFNAFEHAIDGLLIDVAG